MTRRPHWRSVVELRERGWHWCVEITSGVSQAEEGLAASYEDAFKEAQRCLNRLVSIHDAGETSQAVAAERARYRRALEEIANRPEVERNPDGVDQAAATMKLIATEALDDASTS